MQAKALELSNDGLHIYQSRWLRRKLVKFIDYLQIESVQSDGMNIIVYHDGIELKIATSSEHEAENQIAALKERMIERQIKKGGKQIPFEHIGKWVSHIIESEKEEAAPKLADLLLSRLATSCACPLRGARSTQLQCLSNHSGTRLPYALRRN